jgi:hypothetical protein
MGEIAVDAEGKSFIWIRHGTVGDETARNIRLIAEVIDGKSVEAVAQRVGISVSRAHQIVRRFCMSAIVFSTSSKSPTPFRTIWEVGTRNFIRQNRGWLRRSLRMRKAVEGRQVK